MVSDSPSNDIEMFWLGFVLHFLDLCWDKALWCPAFSQTPSPFFVPYGEEMLLSALVVLFNMKPIVFYSSFCNCTDFYCFWRSLLPNPIHFLLKKELKRPGTHTLSKLKLEHIENIFRAFQSDSGSLPSFTVATANLALSLYSMIDAENPLRIHGIHILLADHILQGYLKRMLWFEISMGDRKCELKLLSHHAKTGGITRKTNAMVFPSHSNIFTKVRNG